jgi:hypothetical protein
MEWGFHYAGPRGSTLNPKCVTCLAGLQKECPTHATSFTESCAHCRTAQGAPCQSHWGLEKALAAYVPLDEASRRDFEFAKELVLAEPPSTRPNVVVVMRGDGSLAADGHRELCIRIDARS